MTYYRVYLLDEGSHVFEGRDCDASDDLAALKARPVDEPEAVFAQDSEASLRVSKQEQDLLQIHTAKGHFRQKSYQ
jgi:hypothetical protein